MIQRFEYTHELAWNVMKDYAEYQGNTSIRGSRNAVREAFKMRLINENDAESFMSMIKSRNETSHTYNQETANEIYINIIDDYYPVLLSFENQMKNA